MQHTGTGSSTASLYRGYASGYISTGGKIFGSSVADSNGYYAAPFLPVSMMKKRFAVNVSSDYVAFASTSPAVITVTLQDGSTSTLTLTRSGSDDKTPYYGRLSSVAEGTTLRLQTGLLHGINLTQTQMLHG